LKEQHHFRCVAIGTMTYNNLA